MTTRDVREIAVPAIRQLLASDQEVALIDIREAGEFGTGHALLAVNLPWSQLEVRTRATILRVDHPIIVQDQQGGERARRAVQRLQQLGYRDVRLAQGGVDAWQPLFHGVNVPSKAFSEWIELQAHTPTISAATLHQWQQQQRPHHLIDGRTPEEFREFHIPGAINVPNGELIPWLSQQSIPLDEPIVITCAGRTRGIIGAQALLDAGFPHQIVALAGGTQAWRIDELPVIPKPDHHFTVHAAPLSAAGLAADALQPIDAATLAQWRADKNRTTYLFDVRSREEFVAGSIPGAIWLPAGQLIQTLDEHVTVRNARVVLFDPQQARARFSGWFLHQLGWRVHLLFAHPTETITPTASALTTLFPEVQTLEAQQARELANATLLSADPSKLFLQQRIQGAQWVNRAMLDPQLLAADRPVLLFAHNKALAYAIAWDLQPRANIFVVNGEPADWQAAGWTIDTSATELNDAHRIDYLFWLHDRHSGNAQASRDYLAWEAGLPAAVALDGLHHFRRLTPAAARRVAS